MVQDKEFVFGGDSRRNKQSRAEEYPKSFGENTAKDTERKVLAALSGRTRSSSNSLSPPLLERKLQSKTTKVVHQTRTLKTRFRKTMSTKNLKNQRTTDIEGARSLHKFPSSPSSTSRPTDHSKKAISWRFL